MLNIHEFSNYIKNIRKSLNITQKDASDIMGINSSTLWRIENGYSIPSFDTLLKFSNLYNVNINVIIDKLYDDPLYKFFNFEEEVNTEITKNSNSIMNQKSYLLKLLKQIIIILT